MTLSACVIVNRCMSVCLIVSFLKVNFLISLIVHFYLFFSYTLYLFYIVIFFLFCFIIIFVILIYCLFFLLLFFFFFKQKTAYEMRISDWSSDVCSSDLQMVGHRPAAGGDGVWLRFDAAGGRSADGAPVVQYPRQVPDPLRRAALPDPQHQVVVLAALEAGAQTADRLDQRPPVDRQKIGRAHV